VPNFLGRKDRVIYREKIGQGKKEKYTVQTRYLVMSLKEAWAVFKEKNPGVKIGLSKFCSLRPKHVKCFSDIPHNVFALITRIFAYY
jgi:hypothetical protein